jgi:hypothetical protein
VPGKRCEEPGTSGWPSARTGFRRRFDKDVRPPPVGGSAKDFRPRRASRRSSHRRKSTPPVRDRPHKRKGRFASALSRLCSSWPGSAVSVCCYKYLRWGSTLKPDEPLLCRRPWICAGEEEGGSGGNIHTAFSSHVQEPEGARVCGAFPEAVHARKSSAEPGIVGTLRGEALRPSRRRRRSWVRWLRPLMGGPSMMSAHDPPPENRPDESRGGTTVGVRRVRVVE